LGNGNYGLQGGYLGMPNDIAEYQKTGKLSDQQIVASCQEGYRDIYQYRAKRAALDLRNIEKQVAKAKR
jgi:hypothetical protein